jgi:hypothetical protein
MKVTIIADATGAIIGSVHETGPVLEGAPTEVRIAPGLGQMVAEIELPPELEGVESPTQAFAILAKSYVMDVRTATLTRAQDQGAE